MPPFTPDRFNPSITDAEKNDVAELNDDAVNLSYRWQRVFVCVCAATLCLPIPPYTNSSMTMAGTVQKNVLRSLQGAP